VNKVFNWKVGIDSLQKQLVNFQNEISFLMETLFFVFLGLTLVITPALLFSNLLLCILVVSVLLSVRFVATRVSTFRSSLVEERGVITTMCAQGLTLASLAILAVSLQIPLGDTFLNVATYVIILTNVVATAGSIYNMRRHRFDLQPEFNLDHYVEQERELEAVA
jgi:NhaP-type Na+/H+ or K+/H+ antiporter